MFGTLKRSWRPNTNADYQLSERMVNAWTNFMKNGDPSQDWTRCTLNHPYVKEFDVIS
jgi:carboxylesterase type B